MKESDHRKSEKISHGYISSKASKTISKGNIYIIFYGTKKKKKKKCNFLYNVLSKRKANMLLLVKKKMHVAGTPRHRVTK